LLLAIFEERGRLRRVVPVTINYHFGVASICQ
jgi:hypothetical protein